MFFDEITKSLKEDVNALKSFCYVNVANKGLYVSAKNKIEFYNSCKIILKCEQHRLFIFGQNLKIESMTQTDFCVRGEIFCVSDREVEVC